MFPTVFRDYHGSRRNLMRSLNQHDAHVNKRHHILRSFFHDLQYMMPSLFISLFISLTYYPDIFYSAVPVSSVESSVVSSATPSDVLYAVSSVVLSVDAPDAEPSLDSPASPLVT